MKQRIIITLTLILFSIPSFSQDIIKRVHAIYDDVTSTYRHNGNAALLDQKYLSTGFKNAIRRANQKSEAIGDIGPIDYDHWVQAQDYDRPTFRVDDEILIDGNKASTLVFITNFGIETTLVIHLFKERGNWFIYDFINMENVSERKVIENYLKQ